MMPLDWQLSSKLTFVVLRFTHLSRIPFIFDVFIWFFGNHGTRPCMQFTQSFDYNCFPHPIILSSRATGRAWTANSCEAVCFFVVGPILLLDCEKTTQLYHSSHKYYLYHFTINCIMIFLICFGKETPRLSLVMTNLCWLGSSWNLFSICQKMKCMTCTLFSVTLITI